MIGPPRNVRVYLACGVTDMRRGTDGLSTLAKGRHRRGAEAHRRVLRHRG